MAPVALFFVAVAMKDLRELRKHSPTLRLSGLAALAARNMKHPWSVKLCKHARNNIIIKRRRVFGALGAPTAAAGQHKAQKKNDSRGPSPVRSNPKGSVPLSHGMRTLSKVEIQETFASYDADGSGTLSWGKTKELVCKVSTFDTLAAATNYVNGIFQIFDADKSGCLDVGKFWQLLALLQSSQGADGAQTEAVDVSTDMMETNTLVPNQRGTPVRSLPAEASPVRPTALTVNPVPNHCGCMLNGAIWPGSLDACCRIVRHRSPSVAIASLIADKR
jgi:hypothetical protein